MRCLACGFNNITDETKCKGRVKISPTSPMGICDLGVPPTGSDVNNGWYGNHIGVENGEAGDARAAEPSTEQELVSDSEHY